MYYTAQYKEFDITKPFGSIKATIVWGKNKEKIRKDIAAKATEEKPIVWAIFNRNGVCVNGGVARPGRGNSAVWAEESRSRMAKVIFKVKPPKEL